MSLEPAARLLFTTPGATPPAIQLPAHPEPSYGAGQPESQRDAHGEERGDEPPGRWG